ncbi:hypothetical protein [Paraburkholderia sp. BL6665CI2N2]|uniref:hypothetical protein n=1 Tax=Paraburkholderia sp. BL6665CI2N2 TaxID=1938806 RepID=UPI0010647AB4|nr:hypothetical protein [Paraburkholderia sp. BL6665CI2N2]
MILSGLLASACGDVTAFAQLRSAEDTFSAAFDRSRESGVSSTDDDGFGQFALIGATNNDTYTV